MKRSAVGGLVLDDVRESLVTSSGSLMMVEAIRIVGLRPALSGAMAPWRAGRARHDPGKVLLDVAIALEHFAADVRQTMRPTSNRSRFAASSG